MNEYIRHNKDGGFTVFPRTFSRINEVCVNGRWNLLDYREIALTGERLYVNGDRVEMDAVRILSGPRLQRVFQVPDLLVRFS